MLNQLVIAEVQINAWQYYRCQRINSSLLFLLKHFAWMPSAA